MNEQVVCFVLAGGVGTRLWPLSRPEKPKQFHDLCGIGSMLARTLHRLTGRPEGATPRFVIAAERHADLVHRELAEIDLAGGGVLLEQRGRDTAAAVALATLETLHTFNDSLMLIAPSDHEISSVAQFWETIESGIPAANAGRVMLFGVEPRHADTGYGYVEAGERHGTVFDVRRFIEKPERETAERFVRDGGFFWNAGIFLFRAETMRRAFQALQPALWVAVEQAFQAATREKESPHLSIDYGDIPAVSFDRAIVERFDNLALVPARFAWNDLGSWQALLTAAGPDENGNVLVGDVAAADCRGSYLSSEGRHLSVAGAEHLAIVSTPDAVFVAPVRNKEIGRTADSVRHQGLLPEPTRTGLAGAQRWGHWRPRVRRWLFEQALPLWASVGPDTRHGGFHEAIGFDGNALDKPKRMRTMARQVYAFAAAQRYGWDGPTDQLIDQGLAFISRHGRTAAGGWARALDRDGTVLDATEDSYDHACVLLALAEAHRCGHTGALALCHETLAALDANLRTPGLVGYLDASDADPVRRRSNPHMHLLEAFLGWHAATGDDRFLARAEEVVDLFASCFFDPENWTLGECADAGRTPANGIGEFEPGHHFEWAWLIVDFARRAGRPELVAFARKLYATAVANGINRATGLAFGRVSTSGVPLDPVSRSWPQAEAIKAAIALDSAGEADLKPEIEERVGRLFAWHLDPAPSGLWIDRIGPDGEPLASEVPASILYHLVSALTAYLDYSADAAQ